MVTALPKSNLTADLISAKSFLRILGPIWFRLWLIGLRKSVGNLLRHQ